MKSLPMLSLSLSLYPPPFPPHSHTHTHIKPKKTTKLAILKRQRIYLHRIFFHVFLGICQSFCIIIPQRRSKPMSYLRIFICVTIQNCVNFGDPKLLISKWQSSVFESWADESFQILEIKVFVGKKKKKVIFS